MYFHRGSAFLIRIDVSSRTFNEHLYIYIFSSSHLPRETGDNIDWSIFLLARPETTRPIHVCGINTSSAGSEAMILSFQHLCSVLFFECLPRWLFPRAATMPQIMNFALLDRENYLARSLCIPSETPLFDISSYRLHALGSWLMAATKYMNVHGKIYMHEVIFNARKFLLWKYGVSHIERRIKNKNVVSVILGLGKLKA